MWIPVVAIDSLTKGDYAQVEVEGIIVAVFNVDGQYFAIEDLCTHDGGGLAGGTIEDQCIICPRHGARFSLKSGAALTPPAYENIRSFAVRVSNGMIEIDSSSSK
jgi:3-phenylpropionate/trans-cinnamate dioxygenase ferredoxin component